MAKGVDMEDPYQTRQTLIQRMQTGRDEQSWEEFLRIYRPYLHTVIRNMGMSEHDADDIVQQVMVKVWTHIVELESNPKKSFRSWLSRVTKNCAKDFVRKRVRDAERLEKAQRDEANAYLGAIRLPDIDRIAEREWGIHVFNLAFELIEGLFTGKAIQVFKLSLEGLEVAQIAEKTGLKENSVYRLRNRVKDRISQEIEVLREELE
jgi:RNA polymerase sigma-70 factor (ECF subfamily)